MYGCYGFKTKLYHLQPDIPGSGSASCQWPRFLPPTTASRSRPSRSGSGPPPGPLSGPPPPERAGDRAASAAVERRALRARLHRSSPAQLRCREQTAEMSLWATIYTRGCYRGCYPGNLSTNHNIDLYVSFFFCTNMYTFYAY